VKLGYIVSAYRLPDQLGRLLRRLDDGDATFLVHVDRKTDDATFRRMREGAALARNVTFLDRHVCHWGGFGHVRASLKGIAALVQAGCDFDYAVLLTGQDYPLRAPAAIARYLVDAGGLSFLRNFPLPQPAWDGRGGLDRYESWHVLSYRRLHLRVPLRRRIPGGLTPYGGSPYWCLPREVIEWIHRYVETHPDYVRFFEHVFVPDELFFQTLVLNSPHRDSVVDANLRYIDWSTTPGPKVLRADDLDALLGSGMLFARKFDETVDTEILDLLDRRIDAEAALASGR
jgi:Core-2/I-Branching enzyme